MGRTRRRRLLKKKQMIVNNLNTDKSIIQLNKWLKNNLWLNETKLKIVSFPNTGRGVMSTKDMDSGDIIIELPYELMITYTVLENSENFKSFVLPSNEKFLIMDLLALYILLEYHLEKYSSWNSFLESLPTMNELRVIWLSTDQELGYINEELSIMVKAERNRCEESWLRVQTLLKSQYTCWHCGACAEHVLTRDMYTWAYILVHTRAVYLNPYTVRAVSDDSLSDLLVDDPSMGLCPFLDMINHDYNILTRAFLSDENGFLNYFIVTDRKFKKYEQVFISYGDHDNKRLITQYGFVLPKNEYDTVEFTLKNILTILKLSANSRQYKYISEKLDKFIFINYRGCSFNMVAILYVLTNENEIEWRKKIFSDDYSKEQLATIYTLAKQLLEHKLDEYNNELNQIKIHRLGTSRHFELYVNYLEQRIEFLKEVVNNIVNKLVFPLQDKVPDNYLLDKYKNGNVIWKWKDRPLYKMTYKTGAST